jgi:hypothetical protein
MALYCNFILSDNYYIQELRVSGDDIEITNYFTQLKIIILY